MSGKIVLPLPKDTITTDDAAEFEVIDIARYKMDPAVYVLTTDGQTLTVYFKDITQINGVMVDFKKSNNVFIALGKLKRRADLPQPGDVIITSGGDFEVASVKYHNKSIGLSKGVVFINKEKHRITLNDVIEIKVKEGETQTFNHGKFKQTYREYFAK